MWFKMDRLDRSYNSQKIVCECCLFVLCFTELVGIPEVHTPTSPPIFPSPKGRERTYHASGVADFGLVYSFTPSYEKYL